MCREKVGESGRGTQTRQDAEDSSARKQAQLVLGDQGALLLAGHYALLPTPSMQLYVHELSTLNSEDQ